MCHNIEQKKETYITVFFGQYGERKILDRYKNSIICLQRLNMTYETKEKCVLEIGIWVVHEGIGLG